MSRRDRFGLLLQLSKFPNHAAQTGGAAIAARPGNSTSDAMSSPSLHGSPSVGHHHHVFFRRPPTLAPSPLAIGAHPLGDRHFGWSTDGPQHSRTTAQQAVEHAHAGTGEPVVLVRVRRSKMRLSAEIACLRLPHGTNTTVNYLCDQTDLGTLRSNSEGHGTVKRPLDVSPCNWSSAYRSPLCRTACSDRTAVQ
jgi:hypothetical protein